MAQNKPKPSSNLGKKENNSGESFAKILLLNLLVITGLTSPLWLPVALTTAGIKNAQKPSSRTNHNLQTAPLKELSASAARTIYFELPLRNIIQYDPNCFKASNELIYEPKPESQCTQSNLEYEVTTSFGKDGDRTNDALKASKKPINSILVGDSHAMGWGVSDEDTINAELTRKGFPTLNLSVSSYGTPRELHRLAQWAKENSAEYSEAKNIVIQYCDNDYDENKEFPSGYTPPPNASELAPNYSSPTDNPYHLDYGQSITQLIQNNPQIVPVIIIKFWSASFNRIKEIFRDGLLGTPAAKPLISTGIINTKVDSHSKLFWQSLSNYSKILTGKNLIIFTSNGHGHNNQETTLDLRQGLKKFQQDHPTTSVQLLPLNSLELHKNEAYFAIDDHLTPLGHKLIANEIMALLQTKADQ